jgi:hypothetical protein
MGRVPGGNRCLRRRIVFGLNLCLKPETSVPLQRAQRPKNNAVTSDGQNAQLRGHWALPEALALIP